MYKAWFAKIDECDNCGERLGIRQKKCPHCGKPNQDYQKRNMSVAGIEENEEKKEREET